MHAAPRAASAWPSDPAPSLLPGPETQGPRVVIGRIVRSVDFERILSAPTRARTLHFAIHHVAGTPSLPRQPIAHKLSTELSTEITVPEPSSVDEPRPIAQPGPRVWMGAVIPKRYARRSVTRSLLKRQVRAAMARQAGALPQGLWVVRLRAPFGPKDFPSAASEALRAAARTELDQLVADAVRRTLRA